MTYGDKVIRVKAKDKEHLLIKYYVIKHSILLNSPKYGSGIKNENISNKQLAKELHKPIIWNFHKRKVHSPLIGNILGANLADNK